MDLGIIKSIIEKIPLATISMATSREEVRKIGNPLAQVQEYYEL